MRVCVLFALGIWGLVGSAWGADVIGPTFQQELRAAGLGGVPCTWGSDGLIECHDATNHLVRITASGITRTPDTGSYGLVSEAQITSLQTVLSTHNPTKQLPNAPGFLAWMLVTFDYQTQNTLRKAYPNFYDYISAGNWAGVQWCLTDAKATAVLTAAQYTLFQGANTTYWLGMTLP